MTQPVPVDHSSIAVASNESSKNQGQIGANARQRSISRLQGEKPKSRRGRYNSRACITCQRRKIKCVVNGSSKCQPCQDSGSECVFRTSLRRKPGARSKRQTPPGDSPVNVQDDTTNNVVVTPQPSRDLPDQNQHESMMTSVDLDYSWDVHPHSESQISADSPMDQSEAVMDIAERLARLEDSMSCNNHEKAGQFSVATTNGCGTAGSTLITGIIESRISSDNFRKQQDQEACGGGATSSYHMVNALEDHLRSKGLRVGIEDHSTSACSFATGHDLPELCASGLRHWVRRVQIHDRDGIFNTLKRYFLCLNPHYPALNEYRFFHNFSKYFDQPTDGLLNLESVQYYALVNLLLALMKVLEDYCGEHSTQPGWQEFCRATHLLQHVTWLGAGDTNTVQILLINTLYLLYLGENSAAYAALSRTVCVLFQNGLHGESLNKCFTPFEIHMRQRIFWSVFCLDKTVSQTCGLPYFLRNSECDVHLPAAIDDTDIGNSLSLPKESPQGSVIRYQHIIVQWCRLSSEIWDSIYSNNASSPVSSEFIVTMDARIEHLKEELPSYLQWWLEDTDQEQMGALQQRYIQRQSAIIRLRTNYLRLLLWRQEMLTFKLRYRTAEICLKVATDTVNAICATRNSSTHQELERYSETVYITGAAVTLASIAMCNDLPDKLRRPTKQAFDQAVEILRSISPGLALARKNLTKLGQIIQGLEQVASNKDDLAHSQNPLGKGVFSNKAQTSQHNASTTNQSEQRIEQLSTPQIRDMVQLGDGFDLDDVSFGFPFGSQPTPMSMRDNFGDPDLMSMLTC